MKLKYYLRGLGIGIILTTIILTISYSGRKLELTDEEIIQKAEALGMVMEEDSLFPNKNEENKINVENSTENKNIIETEQNTIIENSEVVSETQVTVENSEMVLESEVTAENSQAMSDSEITMENSETVLGQGNIAENSEMISEQEDTVENGEAEVYRLTIYPGFSANSISRELEQNGIIADRKELAQYLAEVGYSRTLLVGEYEIPYGATIEEIYQILKAGPL